MKYGFIGCGNMGSAILRALCQNTKDIMISDRSGKAKKLAAELGVVYGDNRRIAEQCERIFIGVKPHMVADCLTELKDILAERKPLLISMAAGVELSRLKELVGALPLLRIMPNTPTAIGRGVIPYCGDAGEHLADWLKDMAPCGLLDELDESLMDAAGALSGSGPAYCYILMEALADGAVACGLPRQKAMQYAAATLEGAAGMLLQSGTHPGALKDAVCSPGGSTIAALRVLEQRGFRSAAMDCIVAAWEKNKLLGK